MVNNSELFKTVRELKKKMKQIDDVASDINIMNDLDKDIISEVIYDDIDNRIALTDDFITHLSQDKLKEELVVCLKDDKGHKSRFKKQINQYVDKIEEERER